MLKAGPPSLSWHVKYSLTYRKVIAGLRTQKTTRQERTVKPYEREGGGRERERENMRVKPSTLFITVQLTILRYPVKRQSLWFVLVELRFYNAPRKA